MYGFNQFVTTRALFTADGQTVYVHTATATGDNTQVLPLVDEYGRNNDPGCFAKHRDLAHDRQSRQIDQSDGKVTVKGGNGIAVSGATAS